MDEEVDEDLEFGSVLALMREVAGTPHSRVFEPTGVCIHYIAVDLAARPPFVRLRVMGPGPEESMVVRLVLPLSPV